MDGRIVGAMLLACASVSPIRADPNRASPQSVQRSGIVFGGGIGLGAFFLSECPRCNGFPALPAYQLEAGAMVTSRLAILVDWTDSLHVYMDDGFRRDRIQLLDGAVRGFLGSDAWLEGGVGVGFLSMSLPGKYGFDSFPDSVTGFGFMAGGGVEAVQDGSFALDLSLRFVGAHFDATPAQNVSSFTFLVGFHWY